MWILTIGDSFFLLKSIFFPVLAGLQEKFGEAMRRNDVKAVVLTGKLEFDTLLYNKLIWAYFFCFILFDDHESSHCSLDWISM